MGVQRGIAWGVGLLLGVACGCSPPFLGADASGYGWLDAVVGPIAVFDGEVVERGSVEVDMRGEDGAVLEVQTHPTVTIDKIEVVGNFADNPWRQELYEDLARSADADEPVVLVHSDSLRVEPGREYRIYLWHFGHAETPAYYLGFAWDLDKDQPAGGQRTSGWRKDLDALRSAGLTDGSHADALIDITGALMATDPTPLQRSIIIELVGEAMLPTPPAPPPTNSP